MCGIAGFHILHGEHDPKALRRLAEALLIGIDHRGGDATGAGSFGDGSSLVQRASCKARPFLAEWRGIPTGTVTVLLHTRWATQGKAAFPENNHPVVSGPIHVVHNGHITNDSEVFGYTGKTRHGRVDSEAIPASILHAGWGDVGAALERLKGSFAIAAVNTDEPSDLVLAKAGWSPLVYVTNGRLLVWASESEVITKAWASGFGGKAPRDRHHLLNGDLIRVHCGDITAHRFRSSESATTGRTMYTSDAGWQWNGGYSTLAERVVEATKPATVTPLNLNTSWSADDLLDLIPDEDEDDRDAEEIRCGCCDEWTVIHRTSLVYDELVCGACARELLADVTTDPDEVLR